MERKPINIKRRMEGMRGYLPIAIVGEPKPINAGDVKPGVKYAVQHADDEVLKFCHHDPDLYILQGGCGSLGFALFAFIFSLFKETNAGLPIIIFVCIGMFNIIYGYTMPTKEVILDRKKGLFTYPGFFWGKAITIPFEEAVVNIGTIGFPPGLTLNAFHPNGITSTVLSGYKQIETWNLFVWYMDRNRPLPPGTAFDPYRRKDYERRKSEGFPPPLYPSEIPTPDIFERSFRL